MKLRQTLVLFLGLILLIGLYFGMLYRRDHLSEQVQLAKQAFSFQPADIQKLSIKQVACAASVAERITDNEWRLLEPHPSIVPFNVMWNRVAEHLSTLSNEHTVLESPVDLAPYGLDAPALEVAAFLKDGNTLQIQFGDLEPTQRHRYARLNDGALFLVAGDAFFELNRSLYDLRHRYLVLDREAPLTRLEFAWIWTEAPKVEGENRVETGQESVTIAVERDSDSAPWRIVSPFESPARHEKIQELANEIQFAVCKSFIDNPENLSDYGLQPARARITFRDAAHDVSQTLWLGSADESPEQKGLFVKTEGQNAVQIIDGNLVALLPKSPLEWRDLRLLTGRISDITELTYTSGNDRFVLAKEGEDSWNLKEPQLDGVNTFAVNAFLRFIKEVEGDDFVEDSPAELFANPAARIALRFDNGATAEILMAPAPDKPDTFYVKQDSGGIVSLGGVAVNMLQINSDTFRSLEMARFSKADIADLAVRLDEREFQIARRHDLWVITSPENMELKNQADVDTLLGATNPLRAVGILDNSAVEGGNLNLGLDAPVFAMKMHLRTPGGAEQDLSLDIGGVNPDNPSERFARSSARAGVFRISQEVMDTIREAMRAFP